MKNGIFVVVVGLQFGRIKFTWLHFYTEGLIFDFASAAQFTREIVNYAFLF